MGANASAASPSSNENVFSPTHAPSAVWRECQTADGLTYYWNPQAKVVTWQKPEDGVACVRHPVPSSVIPANSIEERFVQLQKWTAEQDSVKRRQPEAAEAEREGVSSSILIRIDDAEEAINVSKQPPHSDPHQIISRAPSRLLDNYPITPLVQDSFRLPSSEPSSPSSLV